MQITAGTGFTIFAVGKTDCNSTPHLLD